MVTLITYETSDGSKGRCDARCYNAKSTKCGCCCGGMNHGKGLQVAMENDRERAKKLIDIAAKCGFGKIEIKKSTEINKAILKSLLHKSRVSQGVLFDGIRPMPLGRPAKSKILGDQ